MEPTHTVFHKSLWALLDRPTSSPTAASLRWLVFWALYAGAGFPHSSCQILFADETSPSMGQLCSCVEPRRRKLKRERRPSDDGTHRSFQDDSDDDGFSSSGDEIHIIIDGEGDSERDALLAQPTVMTKRTSKSALLRAQSTTASVGEAGEGVLEMVPGVDPRSAVEVGRNMEVLRSYQKATGVVDPGQHELECVMCLDTFGSDNPKVRTLCNCGVNRTNFHLSCLLEWLNRDANCPVCRQYLFYEEP